MAEHYLADETFPRAALPLLRSMGLDMAHVGEFMPSAPDEEVVAEAIRQGAIILTFDLDFGELTFRRGLVSAGIVLFRIRQQPPHVVLGFLRGSLSPSRYCTDSSRLPVPAKSGSVRCSVLSTTMGRGAD